MKRKQKQAIYREKRFVIVIHEHARGGPGDALRDFLLGHGAAKVLLLGHPLLYMEQGRKRRSRFELYEGGELRRLFEAPRFNLPDPFLYVKDFLYTFWWVISKRIRSDVFVGIDPLNALSGIFLKYIGFTKCVVYYSIDYFPTRFSNKFMNYLYHQIDKFCVLHADETWNVGAGMSDARKKHNHVDGIFLKKQHVVPIGVWLSRLRVKQFDHIDKRKLVYAGHLADFMGVDLVIGSMPELKKHFPNISLTIIGTGEEEKNLKDLVRKLRLGESVQFFGWMEDRNLFNERLSDGAVGVATFNTDILDDKVKNADPGKIKDYMGVGLPVIVTRAIVNYKDIQMGEAGIVIDYSVKDFVKAASFLFSNDTRLYRYRQNALSYIKQFDWENIFQKNLERVFKNNL